MAWMVTFGVAYSLFGVALLFFIWQQLFLQTAQKVKGIVVKMDTQPKIRSHDLHAPIIEFETIDKTKVILKTQVFEYPPLFKVGDEVIVYYQASNPQNAKIQHFRHLWFWTSLIVGIGLCFLIVGFLSPNAMK